MATSKITTKTQATQFKDGASLLITQSEDGVESLRRISQDKVKEAFNAGVLTEIGKVDGKTKVLANDLYGSGKTTGGTATVSGSSAVLPVPVSCNFSKKYMFTIKFNNCSLASTNAVSIYGSPDKTAASGVLITSFDTVSQGDEFTVYATAEKNYNYLVFILNASGSAFTYISVVTKEKNTATTAEIDALNRSVDALWKINKGQIYDFETDSNVKSEKTAPSGSKYANVLKLGGKSVVWNQMVAKAANDSAWGTGNSLSNVEHINADSAISATVSTENSNKDFRLISNNDVEIIIGHKYYCSYYASAVSDRNVNTQIRVYNSDTQVTLLTQAMTKHDGTWEKAEWTGEATNASGYETVTGYIRIFIYAPVGSEVKMKNPYIVDLTKMFGAGNEPTDVEDYRIKAIQNYLESHSVKNDGTVVNAAVNKIKCKGLNIFNPNLLELGYYNLNGVWASNNNLGTKTLVEAEPFTRYYVYNGSGTYIYITEWDSNKEFIGRSNAISDGGSFVTGERTRYIAMNIPSTYGTVYKNDVSITKEMSGYHPFVDAEYPVPEAIMNLPGYGWGIGGKYNEVDFENMKYIQRIGRVDLGSLSFSYTASASSADGGYWQSSTSVSDAKDYAPTSQIANILSDIYTTRLANKDTAGTGISMYTQGTTAVRKIRIFDSSVANDDTAFKAKVNGHYMYYELAEPIETDITASIGVMEVDAGTVITLDNGYPAEEVPNTMEYVVKLSEVASNG